MRFEDFTAYLAACGVKRFTIEIDDSRLKETEIPEVREHIIDGFNGAFRNSKVEPSICAETAGSAKCAPPTVEAPVAPTVPRGTEKSAELAKVEKEPAKPAEPVKDEPKAEKPKAEKSKAETAKDKPESVKEKPTEKPAPHKGAYDEFLSLVEKDDGSNLAGKLAPIAERLSLDELLRINNEFGLGLDTDKPTEKIRADLIECW